MGAGSGRVWEEGEGVDGRRIDVGDVEESVGREREERLVFGSWKIGEKEGQGLENNLLPSGGKTGKRNLPRNCPLPQIYPKKLESSNPHTP